MKKYQEIKGKKIIVIKDFNYEGGYFEKGQIGTIITVGYVGDSDEESIEPSNGILWYNWFQGHTLSGRLQQPFDHSGWWVWTELLEENCLMIEDDLQLELF